MSADSQPASQTQRLTRLDRLGPRLAEITGDERWTSLQAELITGGKSNLTYLLSSPAGELVLRRPPGGSILESAHDMGREARIQRALAGTAVPVASILLVDDGELIGAPSYVMQKLPGAVVRDRLPDDFPAGDDARRALGFALVDTLADLHLLDPADVGLADYGRPDGFVERQVRRWRKQWQRSDPTPTPAVDELAERLERSLPAGGASAIVHGDYRLDNCVLDVDDPTRIAAVLDWELSTLGDPLSDLGLLLFYWADAARLTPSLIESVTTQAGFPAPAEVAGRWAARTGLSIDDLGWHHAFAHFKFAAIAAGIDARVRDGAMSGQDFGDLGHEIAATAEAGLAVLGD